MRAASDVQIHGSGPAGRSPSKNHACRRTRSVRGAASVTGESSPDAGYRIERAGPRGPAPGRALARTDQKLKSKWNTTWSTYGTGLEELCVSSIWNVIR